MECLVDDTMNSNILTNCPTCGLDMPLTSTIEHCPHCQNCNSAVVDNNAMMQTHQDFVPLPGVTRPRCCSCLEKTSPITPAVSPPAPGDVLDIPVTRPRSSSTPNQHSPQEQTSSSGLTSSPASAGQIISTDSTRADQIQASENLPDNLQRDHFEADQNSASIYSQLESPNNLDQNGCNLISGAILSDNVTRDSEHSTCPKCGRESSFRGLDLETSDLTSIPGNINARHNNLSAEGDVSTTSSSSPATTAVNIPIQKEESPNRVPPWNTTPHETISQSSETKPHESSQHCPEVPLKDVATPNQDADHPKAGYDSPSPNLTSSQIINHNMEINRITTTRPRKTQQSTKASRMFHHDPRTGAATPQPTRHSLHDIPRIITPDTPLPSLSAELLYGVQDLDHQNEDLSADVVYSLNFMDYQIRELLGKGISSTVRRVTEKSTGAEFAVKIIDISGEKGELSQVEQVKKDTFREIKILRMCAGHSHIIELHDVFETPTFIFLVFEICRKGELFDYLTSVVSLSEKRTRIFMRQLIEAVEFIHDKNIVHRDLKPENILLDDNLNIKVSDFGFATIVEPGEELTELCGTPGYLAPEVLAHSMYENVSGYGKEVDMWACGVIMYTLLCGAPPFWNRRQMMMLRAIMNAEYTFNSPEWDDITDPPKNLIQKLLVVNPKDRLTAKDALKHPFFHSQVTEAKKFQAYRKFRAAVMCVMFYLRLNFFYKHPAPISTDMVCDNPYGIKILRKVIDNCAFSMYKHWVKRVDNQNRAALFEHTLRDDWRHTPMIVDGIN